MHAGILRSGKVEDLCLRDELRMECGGGEVWLSGALGEGGGGESEGRGGKIGR